MPYKNALSPLESNTNNSQLRLPFDFSKLFSNPCWQFVIFLSLAIMVQATGFNKSANANTSKSNSSVVSQLSRRTNGSSSALNRNSNFLPRILNLIAIATKSQPANSSQQTAAPQSTAPKLATFQPIAQSQKSYLADTKFLTKAVPLVHQVKQGETITAIASEYKVSRNDLVKVNHLQNSNVIFVNQRLTIPSHTEDAATNATTPAIANLASVESQKAVTDSTSKAESPNLLQPSAGDPYLAKLRIEVEQRRAQYKQEQAPKLNTDSTNLISSTESPQDRLESQSSVQIPTPKAKLDSSIVRQNLKSNSSLADSLALVLPPLSNSEEYLPSAFDGYIWPAQGVFTSGYGWRWGRLHQGIDIAAPIGTPIVAAAAGEVVGAGWHGGYGNLIKLEHLDGSVTYYAHNNQILVTHGQEVKQGEQIAEMGSTGNSTGSHLHFEIHLRDKTVTNPLALLGSR